MQEQAKNNRPPTNEPYIWQSAGNQTKSYCDELSAPEPVYEVDNHYTAVADVANQVPLYEGVRQYVDYDILPLHTPGHKGGRGMHPLLQSFLTDRGQRADVSVMDELDDLFSPTDIIRQAQDRAARLFHADNTFFMVNGTSGAVLTMMLGCLNEGDKVIVPRNAHRSVLSGLVLTGAMPVYVQPVIDHRLHIAMGVTLGAISEAVKANPTVKAIIITYPTYYGVASDLKAIVDFAHSKGILVLVDAAHGAHLGITDYLPISAMQAGADMSAESTHKMLGSLTQTSMLHTQGKLVDTSKIQAANALVQTTSPNEILLVSLDIARYQMETSGFTAIGKITKLADELRQAINEIDGLWSFGKEYMDGEGKYDLDRTKITVNVQGLRLTGHEASEYLRQVEHIAVELYDAVNILLLLSYADDEAVITRILSALQGLANYAKTVGSHRPGATGGLSAMPHMPTITEVGVSPRQAFLADGETVPIEAAIGRIAKEQIMFYPPGIPILTHGDYITGDIIAYIQNGQKLKLKVAGVSDTTLRTIKVLKR